MISARNDKKEISTKSYLSVYDRGAVSEAVMNFTKDNRTAFVNFLEAQYERLIGKTVVGSYPYFMFIDPTSICNLRCPFCPTGDENEARRSGQKRHYRDRTIMSKDIYDALLDEMNEYLFYIGLYNWGEPLLSKNLPYFIRRAKEADIYTEIQTNLSIELSEQAMEELLLSGIDMITASIDGFSQETYQIYRRGGDFKLVKSNIERLAALKNRLGVQTEIVWNYLVFSFNEHEIKDIEKYCRDRGIIFCLRESYINRESHPHWLPSYRKNELIQTEDNKHKRKLNNGVSFRNISKVILKALSGGHAKDSLRTHTRAKSCAWHYSYSVVNADGSVSPCCAPWEQAYDFGKVVPGKLAFSDIWNNDFFRKSRGVFSSHTVKDFSNVKSICEKCPFDDYVKDQYSPWDKFVHNRFWQVCANDPALKKAFLLLTRSTDRFVHYMREKGVSITD